jgi:excisionase family DNA binding protein
MADIDTLPQLLSIDQLADRLGTTVRHVRRLVADKRIPYLKVGKLVRFDADEITEWLKNHRHPEANRDRSA